jgi:chromosome partitioning protein
MNSTKFKRLITITICQRKGGVGKSTATLNLASVFAAMGYRTLIIDLDDQANTSSSISSHIQSSYTIEDLLLNDGLTGRDAAISTGWENVWMVPASKNLSGVVKHLDSEVGGHLILKEKLACADFDFCFIDNSPSLNMLTINSFTASDYAFFPLASKYFSLYGLGQTLEAFGKVQKRINPELILAGMAFVIHDKRTALSKEIIQKVKDAYGPLLFQTIIGTNIKIEEAQIQKQSILAYAPEDRGAMLYRELGKELFERIKGCEEGKAEAGDGKTDAR